MSVRAPPPVDQLERGPPLLRGGASERGRGAAAVSVRRYDTVISGCRAVVAGAGVVDADVAVLDGRVAAVLGAGESVDAAETIDARGLYVLPGCVDSHTHWGYKGDFADQCRADSRAAALGGTTTVHLLHRATPGGIHEARRIAGDLSSVDFFMTPSVFDPQTAAQVPEWMDGEGHPSIKFYLAYRALESAPEGDDWNELDDGLFLDTLRAMSGRHGALACVHAENAEIINHAWPRARGRASGGLAAWEAAHPAVGEAEAIHRAGLLAESAEVPLYLVHLSGRASLEALARVRASWPATFGETCPHYLVHSVEESSVDVKFSPPVRRRADGEALWEALADGRLDCVGTDNASTRRAGKVGDVFAATRGGPGAGLVLPLILSHGVNAGRLSLERAVEVTSTRCAEIFGIAPRKGSIRPGADADLAIVDLQIERTPTAEELGAWSDHCLYDDRPLRGWPVLTMLRGRVIARDFEVLDVPGAGEFLARPVVAKQ